MPHTSNRIYLSGLLLVVAITCCGMETGLGQSPLRYREFTALKKRIYQFTKVEFITEEGEFNDAICTLTIPELTVESPPFVAIYYKRNDSEWFTESLYRKRVRFSYQDGVIKLDRSNFWDWIELDEIMVVVLY